MQSNNAIIELFDNKEVVRICAPMVRYSKLQFRTLVRSYGCDLCYTPMIMADSFCLSNKARLNEFTTNQMDSPLVVQFAANTAHDFVGAAHLVAPFCDGIDLNCGCPQRWAKQLGLGCKMLEQPQVIYELVREFRNRITKPITLSVKMRLSKNLKTTVEICRELDRIGVDYLTVHARTPDQITGDINKEALKLIQENVNVPIVANGGVKTFEDCQELSRSTQCKGIMVANGILSNPELFSGANGTSFDCIQKWLDICYNTSLSLEEHLELSKANETIPVIKEKPLNLTFQCFHHHLVFMLEKNLTKSERKLFNNLQHFHDVQSFLKRKFAIEPRLYSRDVFDRICVREVDYGGREEVFANLKPGGKRENVLWESPGKFFSQRVQENEEDECCDWSDMFLEND